MITIIFEAHGTTFDNEAHLSSGHNDVELSPLGIQQSKEMGERYKDDHFDAIFCSDLQRAYKSAEIGFGTKNYNESVRFLNQDGTVNVKRKASDKHIGFDLYHWLLGITWTQFFVLVFVSYVVVNTLFAIVYFLILIYQLFQYVLLN